MPAQGDIIVYKLDALPTGAKSAARDSQGRIVLAYGETHGHAHAVLDATVELFAPGEASRSAEPASAPKFTR